MAGGHDKDDQTPRWLHQTPMSESGIERKLISGGLLKWTQNGWRYTSQPSIEREGEQLMGGWIHTVHSSYCVCIPSKHSLGDESYGNITQFTKLLFTSLKFKCSPLFSCCPPENQPVSLTAVCPSQYPLLPACPSVYPPICPSPPSPPVSILTRPSECKQR